MNSLTSLGLKPNQAVDLLSYAPIGKAQGSENPLDVLFDSSDRIERGLRTPASGTESGESQDSRVGAITWWNDLEKDEAYKKWPSELRGVYSSCCHFCLMQDLR